MSIKRMENKRFELKVTGRIEGESVEKVYKCTTKPNSKDEVKKIAEDFDTISYFRLEQITTVVKKETIFLR